MQTAQNPIAGERTQFSIGDRVRFNDGVACPFIGQPGTIIGTRESVIDGHLYVVQLDTPTAAATHWTPCETLAVGANDMNLIPETLIESAAQAVEEIDADELERFAAHEIMAEEARTI